MSDPCTPEAALAAGIHFATMIPGPPVAMVLRHGGGARGWWRMAGKRTTLERASYLAHVERGCGSRGAVAVVYQSALAEFTLCTPMRRT